MGLARWAVYLVGLALVVAAAWVFLTRTDIGQSVPAGVALAVILLLVGIGVMASARSVSGRRTVRQVTYEGSPGAIEPATPSRPRAPPERVVEERRYDE